MTAYHVIEGSDSISVTFSSYRSETFQAIPFDFDEKNDFAVVYIRDNLQISDEIPKLPLTNVNKIELMDEVSFKRSAESILVLNRFLEEEDSDGPLRVLEMLNRQIRLLWQAKTVSDVGGRTVDVGRKLGLPAFLASKMLQQSKHWETHDFERAFRLLYQADGLLKSGAQGHLVLENLVLSLCE